MPAKLTDAMAMAKPIISSALSDIPQYLESCGMVVAPDDVAALAEKIRWVVEHREKSIVMGQCARERFMSKLTYDGIYSVIAPVIKKLLLRKGRI